MHEKLLFDGQHFGNIGDLRVTVLSTWHWEVIVLKNNNLKTVEKTKKAINHLGPQFSLFLRIFHSSHKNTFACLHCNLFEIA